MKVRVERIRRGQRTAEVEYIETRVHERRRSAGQDEHNLKLGDNPWGQQEVDQSGLRLPWRINSRRS